MSASDTKALIAQAVEQEASDLHLIVGVPPAFRINGEVILADEEVLSVEALAGMAYNLLNPDQREKFDREWELCISLPHGPAGRTCCSSEACAPPI